MSFETFTDFGPCCSCGKEDVTVRNIMMLRKRAPTPGTGWGCFRCGLPSDGAIDGYPKDKKRVPIGELSIAPFEHDMSKHPGEV